MPLKGRFALCFVAPKGRRAVAFALWALPPSVLPQRGNVQVALPSGQPKGQLSPIVAPSGAKRKPQLVFPSGQRLSPQGKEPKGATFKVALWVHVSSPAGGQLTFLYPLRFAP